jgi:hypothetical protein
MRRTDGAFAQNAEMAVQAGVHSGPRFMHNAPMDTLIKDKILAVTRQGRSRAEATDWFRVAVGLYYLAGLMTKEAIDFKAVDRDFNRFIYHAVGGGHTITSVLQFLSGRKVLPIVQSPRFIAAFGASCTEVPVDSIPFLLELNLGVARGMAKQDVDGALNDWLQQQKALLSAAAGQTDDAAPGRDI